MSKYLSFLSICLIIPTFLCCNYAKKKQDNNGRDNKVDMTDNESTPLFTDSTSVYLLIGTYTTGKSDGIYVYHFNTETAGANLISSVKIPNPSFLVVSENEKFVYAVSENNDETAAANAFSFDKKNGRLKYLNSQPTGGSDPCYITTDREGKYVVTANYSGSSVTLFKVMKDGRLNPASQVANYLGSSINPKRQEKSHPHCVEYSPDGRFLFASDLGVDKLYKYEINNTNKGNYLQSGIPYAYEVAEGSGPRHFKFHPDGKYMYLLNELSGAIICYNYNEDKGELTAFQTIQADPVAAEGSADINISPDGRFLYASNRLQNDGIAIFSVNRSNGELTKIGYQNTAAHPRNFVITPNGKFLLVASRDEGKIQIFEIDKNTGLLSGIHRDIIVDMPVCLKFISYE